MTVKKLEYGYDRTIHRTTNLNVETRNGKVVAVWFRCLSLPFDQSECDEMRAKDMERMSEKLNKTHKILAINVEYDDA